MNTSNVLLSSNNEEISWASNVAHSGDLKQDDLLQEEPVSEEQVVEPEVTESIPRPVRFKIRIADLDHYMVAPGPLDLGSCQFLPLNCPVLKVPIVRIYGANEAGQKTCLHIHRAYPYFYVPYDGSLEPSQIQAYIHQLGTSLNHAACITFNSPQDPRKSQYVAAITPVKGIPFYGYHVGYSCFLKIYLFNPDFESRIVDLMRSGAIMGTQFQPFESHIPFRLQFFIDYNLYGMGWLELEEALLRNDIPASTSGDHPKRLTKSTVSDTRIWAPENDPGRISHCEIEMDSTVERIINRDKVLERDIHCSLQECFKPPPLSVQVPSMAGLWEDDERRRRANNLPTQELPKTQIRDPVTVPWLNHDLNKQMIANMVREIVSQSQAKTPEFDNFNIEQDPLIDSIPTAYSSVNYLCPRESSDPNESIDGLQETSFVFDEGESSILVDESILSQAFKFGMEDIDTRKEIFKGLAGLGGLEEQDDDDDFPLPDMDDFNEEDFLNELEQWDDMDSSDPDTPERSITVEEDKIEPYIPQFDGGDDSDDTDPQKPEDCNQNEAKNWGKVIEKTRGKRTRSSSSSLLITKEKPHKPKRFCEIVSSTSTQDSTDQLKGSSRASEAEIFVSVNKEFIHNPSNRIKRKHPYTPIQAHETQMAETSNKKTRKVVRFVQIPRYTKSDSGSNNLSPDNLSSGTAKFSRSSRSNVESAQLTTRLAPYPSDDPIIDDDDDQAKIDSKEIYASRAQKVVQATNMPKSNDGKILMGPSTKLNFQYPEPVPPDRNYFLSSLDEMWSSPSPPPERPAFYFSPPHPTSPVETNNRTSSQSLPDEFDHGLVLSSPQFGPDTKDCDETSKYRKDSTVVDQTFIIDPHYDKNDAVFGFDHDLGSQSESSEQDIQNTKTSKDILVEDSIIIEAFDPEYPGTKSPRTPLPTYSIQAEPNSQAFRFIPTPPTTRELVSTLSSMGLPDIIYQKPYFSNESDVPSKVKVFGGKEFRTQSNGVKSLPAFKTSFHYGRYEEPGNGFQFWEPNQAPPSRSDIQRWLDDEKEQARKTKAMAGESTQKRRERISQIEGPTPKNPFGYKNSPTKFATSVAVEKDFLDVLSMEIHCHTRGSLLPDPKVDSIQVIFYCWQAEREGIISNGWVPGYQVGMFTHADAGMMDKLAVGRVGYDIHVFRDEGAMMNGFIEHVLELDPDILAGYEIQNHSWGYLVDRYQVLFELDMSKLLSRIKPQRAPILHKSAMEARDTYNSKNNSGLKLIGRHLFNVWRLIRGEVALTNYSFCNVVFHVLQQRVPYYSHETLTKWWTSGIALHQSRVIRNYLHRVQYVLQLIESQELVSRTSEFARVFGVDFFSVISRGSQYKVESMMIRLAKPEDYIMISPSTAQVAGQRALEVIPMVMEPESGFYEDPVVVLDFQSLYPSVMIAYNICFSTCLGKIGGGTKLGVSEYKAPEGFLPLAEDHLHVAPNNVMYVNQDIRRGLLGRMLAEILDTRVMIKKAMKEYPTNKSLLKLLDARQLSLKLIANVTYGYTSASYSGRMPGAEIADSIVHSGRETLERSIRFVNQNPKWNARVVYGDTDSMFVHLKGRTRQEAFEIGYDIAETITRMNPRPVKLKFEKVYHPCFLVTKKRYVGSSYETLSQKEPIFDAKGIETIRRDGVPAVQKIMETCIKTQDLSQVKTYLIRQLAKILEGRVPVPDLMFGKEVRLSSYSEKGVPPPGAIVSLRKMEFDPRSEPQHRERVPYVVVYGDPGARLTDQVVEPKELLLNKDLRLNGEYYIRKQIIPSLERIFQLAGADVKSWYEEMPRTLRIAPPVHISTSGISSPTIASTDSDVNLAASIVSNESTSTTAAVQQLHQPNMQVHNGASFSIGSAAGIGALPTISGPPKFKPRRRGGKGYVSVGPRIDRYYQSQLCVICGKMIVGQKANKEICGECNSEDGLTGSIMVIHNRLRKAERLFQATLDVCGSCCRSTPNGGIGVGDIESGQINSGTELVACESIECSVFWQRRRAQDSVLQTHHLKERVMNELLL
ncbi:DNA polymerase zeta [Entomortierella beljakovae]|nr:DNA polymerase zeta [Entomortierella beljakovae]